MTKDPLTHPMNGAVKEPYLAMIYMLYMLRSLGSEATREELDYVVATVGRLNYFMAMSYLETLVNAGHIKVRQLNGQDSYYLGRTGRESLLGLSEDLSPTIRRTIDEAVTEYFKEKYGKK